MGVPDVQHPGLRAVCPPLRPPCGLGVLGNDGGKGAGGLQCRWGPCADFSPWDTLLSKKMLASVRFKLG